MKNDKFYLESVVDNIHKIESFVEDMQYEKFARDTKTQFAVYKAIENIGEAVKNISQELKSKYPTIPWKDIAGMRDNLIHEYFGIEAEIYEKVSFL